MSNTSLGAAQEKAYTARPGMPSGELHQAIKADPTMLATPPNMPRIVLIPGGLPLVDGRALFGAVGVGGVTPTQDLECAQAGLQAIEAA